MALHVTSIANVLPTMPAASSRRLAADSTAGGSAAAKAATADTEAQLTSSFDSLLARSAVAERPAAEIITAAGRRTAATSAAASLAATATGAGAASSSTAASSGLSDFELLFGGSSYNPADPMATAEAAAEAAAASAASAAKAATPPTAQSAFGPNVWMSDPIGLNPDGTTFEYNPIYFATESTAQTVAQMVGGTVVTENVFTQPASDPFVQQQPNYMVQMPNGALINPGLVASFYTFGFSQSQIDTMIAQEVANTPPPAQTT
ncbi:MAG: hypothetical protein ACLQPN_06235 [Bryobacteraceae bacterium]